jgi:hypothetical protein
MHGVITPLPYVYMGCYEGTSASIFKTESVVNWPDFVGEATESEAAKKKALLIIVIGL